MRFWNERCIFETPRAHLLGERFSLTLSTIFFAGSIFAPIRRNTGAYIGVADDAEEFLVPIEQLGGAIADVLVDQVSAECLAAVIHLRRRDRCGGGRRSRCGRRTCGGNERSESKLMYDIYFTDEKRTRHSHSMSSSRPY